VALLLFDEVELLDAAAVAQVLSVAGRHWNWRPFRVTATARQTGRVTTRGQLTLEASVDLRHCPRPEIVVVPGGYGARRFATEEDGIAWLSRVGQDATHVVAIGAGVGALGRAGLLGDEPVAASDDLVEWLGECGVRRPDPTRRVVSSDRIFTGARSGDAVATALALVAAVLGDKQARTVAEALGHPWASATTANKRVHVDIVSSEK
jgi:transcriptional regulator GlxA family with amidase domain